VSEVQVNDTRPSLRFLFYVSSIMGTTMVHRAQCDTEGRDGYQPRETESQSVTQLHVRPTGCEAPGGKNRHTVTQNRHTLSKLSTRNNTST
jgi:hypothetical protein